MAVPEHPPGMAGRILEAARALFAEQGYRATSMRQIAERVGVTKAALYYHFPAKNEILHHLTGPLLDELEAALADAERHADPETVRWRAIEGYLDVFLRHRETLLVLVRDMSLLVEAPVADRFRAAVALAGDLVAGPDRSLANRVRSAQAVAGLGDAVAIFADVAPEVVREHVLDGVRALLGPPARRPEGEPPAVPVRRGRPRGRGGGRPAALTPAQAARARELYASGQHTVERIAAELGVSRSTVYRVLRTG